MTFKTTMYVLTKMLPSHFSVKSKERTGLEIYCRWKKLNCDIMLRRVILETHRFTIITHGSGQTHTCSLITHTHTHWPVLVGTAEAGEDHVAETASSVQFRLTLGPLDWALQPFTEETLEYDGGRGGGEQWRGRTDGGGQGGRASEVWRCQDERAVEDGTQPGEVSDDHWGNMKSVEKASDE